MTNNDPFQNSKTLADWAASLIRRKKIDQIAAWQMLEYWFQVELYRAIETGEAGNWRYLGEYEQPYFTERPKGGAKYNVKYIDLVLAEPNLDAPRRIVWIELKDLGRFSAQLKVNARGVGHDLAALYHLKPEETAKTLLKPPVHIANKGRTEEWREAAGKLPGAEHLISQIVIVHENLLEKDGRELLISEWQRTAKHRAGLDGEFTDKIESSPAGKFNVLALVSRPLTI